MPSRHAAPPCPTPDGQRRERPPPRALTEETPTDGVHDAVRCARRGAREESSCIRADPGVACEKRVSVPDPVGHVRERTDAIMLDDERFLTEAALREQAPSTAAAVRRGSIDRGDHVAAVLAALWRTPRRSDASRRPGEKQGVRLPGRTQACDARYRAISPGWRSQTAGRGPSPLGGMVPDSRLRGALS